ncbi:MAG: hypothetical protein HY645_13515 [Acidobacteria bacterium]|nr:hypothetical protein [Acidobacteriota bacterium]
MPTKDSKLRNQFEKAVCQQISREEWDKLEKDNWELIKFAAQVGTLDWAACVLIFPGEWYMGSRPGFSEMDNYLRRIFSLQARPFTHEATVYDSEHANKPKLKWLPVEAVFYYETIKHLFQITRGDVPAFQPVVKTKQPAGPFSQFQELIVSNRIGRFFPVIFQPCHLTDSGMTGFYSLRRPSVLAYIPPKARSWKLFLDEIALDLKKFAAGDQYIDLGRTEFFCRSLARKGEKSSPRLRQTRDDRTAYSGESGLLKDVSEIPTKDWAPKDSKISLDVEFYHALIKLTRK